MKANDTRVMPGGGPILGFAWSGLAAIACLCCLVALPLEAADEPAAATAPPTAPVTQHQPALDQRVALIAKELSLDERQQAALRRILINQRLQIMKLWNDTSIPAASRVGATRVLSEQTGDQIRAMLTDEQKAKYNHPRKPRDTAADPNTRSVEDWMKATSRN